jgi:hypothetical protein
VKLASGLEIANPLKLLLAFVKHWYSLYDGVTVKQDNELPAIKIILTAMRMSRTAVFTGIRIHRARQKIEEALAAIPPNLDLLDVPGDDPIPGSDSIGQAITVLCSIPRVTLAVSTKILHKKRPGLIPIFDRFVGAHYFPRWCQSTLEVNWGSYAVDLIKLVHKDMLSVGTELCDLQSELQANGTPLTPCRILNVLTWIVKSGNEKRIIERARAAGRS